MTLDRRVCDALAPISLPANCARAALRLSALYTCANGVPYRSRESKTASARCEELVHVDLTELIEARPGVRSGKPCFVGTRFAVYDVLGYLASGMTVEEIVTDLPELTERHVRAAIEFAALRERRLATPA